ncbi:MAG: polysaccharide deacetylase family protein [Proteobacteria bacterium]|jgi:predicted deacetylase|nr:polysaccharide deacetylase family protein [Pseudomonadota bacterium]
MHAMVSIHDVMPDTLSRVEAIVARLPVPCRRNLTLLVVPGLEWQASQIDSLRRLERDGCILAGHGWTHRARTIKGPWHRLHALLISRNAAEHLALGRDEIIELIRRSRQWFESNGLVAPDLYVPPAWALGAVSRQDLTRLPYRYYETTSGIFDASKGRRLGLPLAGFEADNRLREGLLRISNVCNRLLSGPERPLRIAIHPHDFEYRLGDRLTALLGQVSINYSHRDL